VGHSNKLQDLENPARKAAFKKSRAKNSAETRELEGLKPSHLENPARKYSAILAIFLIY